MASKTAVAKRPSAPEQVATAPGPLSSNIRNIREQLAKAQDDLKKEVEPLQEVVSILRIADQNISADIANLLGNARALGVSKAEARIAAKGVDIDALIVKIRDFVMAEVMA